MLLPRWSRATGATAAGAVWASFVGPPRGCRPSRHRFLPGLAFELDAGSQRCQMDGARCPAGTSAARRGSAAAGVAEICSFSGAASAQALILAPPAPAPVLPVALRERPAPNATFGTSSPLLHGAAALVRDMNKIQNPRLQAKC